MKLDITVTEVNDLIKVIQERPKRLFEMTCSSVKHGVGEYLSELINDELTGFLGLTTALRNSSYVESGYTIYVTPMPLYG